MTLRDIARRNPLLFRAAGFYRRMQHRSRLRAANLAYDPNKQPPVPPPELRFRVHGALPEAGYVQHGRAISETLAEQIVRHQPATAGLKILDLGSGPGRVATGLKQMLPGLQLFCTDIDSEAIEWAQKNLADVADFQVNLPDQKTR